MKGSRIGIILWIVQALLAALFLLSGGMKLVLPAAVLTKGSPFSAPFLRFIGVAEIVGALGLVLPGITRIKPVLTPLAAIGLLLIMAGATVTTVATLGVKFAILPFVTGILAAFVAYGRRHSGTAFREDGATSISESSASNQ